MRSEYRANAESVLYGYYIKYEKLLELDNIAFSNTEYSNCNEIDIYIDLYDMLFPLYNTTIYSNKQFVIVSSIINLVAHLREYYWSRHRVNTRIFLVYADCSTPFHKQYYYDFGNKSVEKMLNYDETNKVIMDQLEMVKIITAYIYNVYYVRKSCDFATYVYSNIYDNNRIPSLIITKSDYAYQLPALFNHAILYRPKKNKGNDESFVVNRNNVLYVFCSRINNPKVFESLKFLNSKLLSLLITMTSLPSKKIIALFNISLGIKHISKAVLDNRILNDINSDILYVYNNMDISSRITSNDFANRYYAVDLQHQYLLYSNTAEALDYSYMINLRDRDTIHYINNTYFEANPLHLDSL